MKPVLFSRWAAVLVGVLREASKGDPKSVATIQVEAGQSFIRTFNLRQNDVYFIKISPDTGR